MWLYDLFIFGNNFRGTCHQNQSDFSLFVTPTMGKLLHTCGKLNPQVAMDINNGAAIAFICKKFGKCKLFFTKFLLDIQIPLTG